MSTSTHSAGKTVLLFSGGKDSLACLHLLRPRWDEITVVWVNTGAAFPETLIGWHHVKSLVPHHLEVKSQQSISERGYPADLLPVDETHIGHVLKQSTLPYRFQSRIDCCSHSLWMPTARALQDLGTTTIIRGQKLSDRRKGPLRNGDVVEGITYEYPIETWTDADVLRYLAEKKVVLPPNYEVMTTGLDCWNCTAYLDENRGRLKYMRKNHPGKYAEVHGVLEHLSKAASKQFWPLREAVKE